jgi:group I intron endonuclease
MIIYQITNKVNNDFYIGKTVRKLTERFSCHKSACKNGSKTHLHRAMRKYGIENFTVETICVVSTQEELNEKEIQFIESLQPKYNMTKGGDGGDTSGSTNYKLGMKNRVHPHTPTYGMLGKKHPMKGKSLVKNCCPVICNGVEYSSVGEAQKAYPGISIRKRIDNPKYPDFYRLKGKTIRK